MPDPVSLSLAIVPLVIEALKCFRSLNSKLKIYKCTNNQSQIEAFLKAGRLDGDCYDTLKRLYLGTRQRSFQSTFHEIKTSIEDIEAELDIFEQIEYNREDNESLRDSVGCLRYRLKITINKTNYDEALERLKQSNYDLKSIRKHAKELGRDLACTHDAVSETKLLPLECSRFGKVGLAALAFYEAMVTHWVCDERKHQRHLIKLFAKAKWIFPEANDVEHLDLISLEVRSQSEIQRQSRNRTVDSRAVKPRRVRWTDEKPTSTSSAEPLSNLNGNILTPPGGINAKSKVKVSQYTDVPDFVITAQRLRDLACLGHLDVTMRDLLRHSFYPWSGICNGSMTASKVFTTIQPLTNIFNQPVYKNFDVVDQLLMAKTMVATMLKFHPTHWLRSYTLHLGAFCLPRAIADDSMLSQRIRNTVLHNFGYRDIVQKCLYCDFGVGTDLLEHRLQTAIPDKVMMDDDET
ncbi:hypothetical protein F5Y09DRAFT_331709 [Xylaria sp. FL1042]|nr:hypothetical protein F5Y09DRAFT_331709 [Xylaria sp. FL1042]